MEYNMEWLISDYGKFLEKFGLDETSVRSHYQQWHNETKKSSAQDYLWYLFQVILGETAKQVKNPTDLQKNNLEIYTAMWFFQTHVEGQPANHLLQLINETKVRLWQLELPFYFRVKVMAEGCCSYCEQYHQQLVSPGNILQQQKFVVANCTNANGCQCFITPVAERNADNQLVLKNEQSPNDI